MPYTPTTYVDLSAPDIDATNLNKLETAASKMAYGPDGLSGQVPVADGAGNITWKKLTASEVSPSAAIPASALAGYPADASKYLTGGGTWVSSTVASGELDYQQITTNSSAVTATTEGTAVAIITGNAVTFDGTTVVVEFFAPKIASASSTVVGTFVLYRDSTVLGQMSWGSTASSVVSGYFGRMKDTPSATSHTYKLGLFVSSSNVTVNAGAGGSGNLTPAYLRVVKA